MKFQHLLRRIRGAGPDPGDLPVLWLGEPGCDDPRRVGGKAAALSRLAARWPVPDGFCLPVEVHRRLRSEELRPPDLRHGLRPAYRRLADSWWRRPPVAVRSSAPGEDSADASFAGQHDTVLNAVGIGAVADAVLACCQSVDADRARAYRAARDRAGAGDRADGRTEDPARMAVLVQRLVDADVSAVVFSADPVTGSRDEVLINASWGLGEAVVAGTVTPDTYRLSRQPVDVVDREIADKDVMVAPARRGTREVAVPQARRTQPALDLEQCTELARLAIELEAETGRPVDLECAYHDGELYLLQCRPITSLPEG